ncbi:NAD(P)/FAD-dependent oxidoreductase [Rhodococcus sp. USK10]|uniref:NAD(P)/FAD-dependent oxidoreductase n=1 Tax=Rhodococcus sp. USK10 TaxID=2789739 RepID=UPI001C5D4AFA|nr:NAD(P)/FAD-dependent oxidoreductase [Rhodococcus sp. USK10]QYB00806.1 NAD(P)/FAD-dependent oxidoreductase [Rhodococcus sp. USK10]
MSSPVSRHRVVVVGSGFGGLHAAKSLRRAGVDVTVIDRTGHHLFQPLLYQVATGILSEGEIAAPTRMILKKQANTKVLVGAVTGIDLTAGTVTSQSHGRQHVTPFDSLIVSAGAQQSYFGNDSFAEHAPGMKTIDDALELRARILSAFEAAELTTDATERDRLLTFVVVGAGPTGIELAGQIADLARRTLTGAYRNIDAAKARVIVLDAAPTVLPAFGSKLGAATVSALKGRGVEVHLGAAVVDLDEHSITVQNADGDRYAIHSSCKIWSAGVAASSLGAQLAEQTGAAVDRAGRVLVEDDLTLPDAPNVYVIGDMMSHRGAPGVAQLAMQSGRYAARQIAGDVRAAQKGRTRPLRKPFQYRDKGSMATIARFKAVAKIGPVEFSGILAWVLWLAVHIVYVVGFRSRVSTLMSWLWSFLGTGRGQLATTDQQAKARNVLAKSRLKPDGAGTVAERSADREVLLT